ncbi:MAG: glycine betaine/L-proline ABC transporter ATP-binding protein [Deltaproteobacteria bacterium]|nr:glycine betaine/L-proline ABC transporter ATP-binding protein [Candidatus Anaeroferrophillus wilburensis]MBN2889620.1 glycine betaine/L-proline ABC transporter ATP-binding protein [Deltaproteobacteria bacterium]
MSQVKICVKNVSKVFGSHPERALKLLNEGVAKDEISERTGQTVGLYGASFDVYEGEILVIMGLSGSGKSTLIRCLNLLNKPTTGSIIIDGEDLTSVSHDHLMKIRQQKFGMVFQHFALFPHRTVLRNSEYGLEIQGVEAGIREEKGREALKLVGLEGWEDSYPHQLSGGMQQRVGLARALAVDPDILLMDEAFSALDPLIRRDMQHELVALQSRVKKTIVFITHDLDEALKIGDRIILMKDGKIVQIGTPEDILENPSNRYVEKFVKDVDKSKVLSVSSIMAKAKVVAFPADGPRTALHKMRDEGISSIFVVDRDYTFRGLLTADKASEAIKHHQKPIDQFYERGMQAAGPDEPVNTLFAIMAETNRPVPVVNDQDKLLGVVTRVNLLASLAEGE